MLQQLIAVWSSMAPTRKIAAVAGVSVSALAVFLLVKLAMAPGYALLYGNLEYSQAGEVVAALDRQGAKYQVRGSTIYVEEGRRDELRMLLATEGLPTNSGSGYELLDKLTGFGTTSQMFDAAYARAIEGELARTISASAFVREARVHIARNRTSTFQRESSASASVFVKPAGAELSIVNSKALKFLISSAVSGLSADNVTIIDSITGTIIDGAEDSVPSQKAHSKSKELESGVVRILEPHVGRGNAIVEINLEVITDTESIIERRFDPDGQVAVSTDTHEVSNSSSGPAGGAVTVASNVPSGDAAGSNGEAKSQGTETRERTNFEVSEVQREVRKVPGAIRRLTVAVLVNGVTTVGGDGTSTWRPRTEQELAVLQDLVQSAVGFRQDRGDVVTIKSLEFENVEVEGSAGSERTFDLSSLDAMTLIQLVLLSVVVLLLGLFVVRPVFLNRNDTNPTALGVDGVPELDTLDDIEQFNLQQTGDEIPSADLPQLAPIGDLTSPMAVVEDFEFNGVESEDTDDAVGQLKQVIESRKPDTIEILRGWLAESEKQEEYA